MVFARRLSELLVLNLKDGSVGKGTSRSPGTPPSLREPINRCGLGAALSCHPLWVASTTDGRAGVGAHLGSLTPTEKLKKPSFQFGCPWVCLSRNPELALQLCSCGGWRTASCTSSPWEGNPACVRAPTKPHDAKMRWAGWPIRGPLIIAGIDLAPRWKSW